MKYRLWAKYLLTIPLLLPFTLRLQPAASQNFKESSISQIAQDLSIRYGQLMEEGYAAFDRKDFPAALKSFRNAFDVARGVPDGARAALEAITNTLNKLPPGREELGFVSGGPARSRSAAGRGNCFPTQKPPIPLVPPGEKAVLTTQEYPTFYFYIPKIEKDETKEMEFVLRDDIDQKNITPDNLKPLYRQTFRFNSQDSRNIQDGGIIKVRIPLNSQPLQVGKRYVWGFSLICDQLKRDEDLYTEGKIERRQNEALTAYLQQIQIPDQQYFTEVVQRQRILERARLYTVVGFWENSLFLVADLHSRDPNDIVKEYWQVLLELLQQEGSSDGVDVLDAINKPFLPLEPIPSKLNILEPRPSESTPSEPTPSEQKTSHQTENR